MRKRILIFLFVLVISVAACTAYAEELPAEEYFTLGDTGLEIWITPEVEPFTLTEENLADNYIAYFINETGTRTVDVMFIPDYPGSREDYAAGLYYLDGVSDVTLTAISDIPCITYILAYPKTTVFKVTMLFENKDFMEITFSPYDDPEYRGTIDRMVQSIRKVQ